MGQALGGREGAWADLKYRGIEKKRGKMKIDTGPFTPDEYAKIVQVKI